MKQCSKCQNLRSVDWYVKGAGNRDGLHPWCRECRRDYVRERRANGTHSPSSYNKDKTRQYALKHYYGLTVEKFDELMEAQGGTCAACPAKPSESTRAFHVDHDHSCCPGNKSCGECVRGVLCQACNTALGIVKDSPDTLRRLAQYLEKLT